MTTYIADGIEANEYFEARFHARSWRIAENTCRRRGWTLIGELVSEEDCPADVEAQIYKYIYKPTMH